MSHQPFEAWLLSEEPLTPEQARSLEDHLRGCRQCTRLAGALQEVAALFRRAQPVSPSPGFVSRWHGAQSARRQQDFRRQALGGLLALGLASIVMALLGSAQWLITTQAPLQILTVPVYQVLAWFSLLDASQDVILALLRVLPPAWWASFAALLSALSLLWVFLISRPGWIASRGR